jgi:hypothetical protein
MVRALLILALALPAAARAEDLWRWRDAAGRLHYSNVPDHAPSGAAQIGGGIGFLQGSVDEPDAKEIQDSLAEFERIHQQRAITRRLEEIQAFQNGLRIRQRERLLEGYANVELLADWQVADQWLQLRDEQVRLEQQLHELRQPPGS